MDMRRRPEARGMQGAALFIAAVLASCGVVTPMPGRSVVLPPEQAEYLLHPCSRAAPSSVDGTWPVTSEVIEKLEANLSKLTRVRAKECCILKARVQDPAVYYRQYIGIIVDGRKLVYVNAFRSLADHEQWQTRAVDVCDGGEDYWGVVYDPEMEEFSQLAVNGVS